MIVIPAIDLYEGGIVRLQQGEYSRMTRYAFTPLEAARRYESEGYKRLHMVDLQGAESGEPFHLDVLEEVAVKTSLEVQYGGGLRNLESLERVFNAGASRAIIGSLAVRNPDRVRKWIESAGADSFILAIDIKNGVVASAGWKVEEARTAEQVLDEYGGFNLEVLSTDVSRDGMMQGPNLDMYRGLMTARPQFRFIASGGVRHQEDLSALAAAGLHAAVVGKAFLDNQAEAGCSPKE